MASKSKAISGDVDLTAPPPDARTLVLDVFVALAPSDFSTYSLVKAGELYGFSSEAIRASLTRLKKEGHITSPRRGIYTLTTAPNPWRKRINSWYRFLQRYDDWDGGWLSVATRPSSVSQSEWRLTERAFTIEGFRQTAQGPWLRPNNLVGGVDACRERLTELGAVIGLMGRIDGLSEEEVRAVRSLWNVRELGRIRSALLRGIRQRKGRLRKMKLEDAAREGLSTGRAAVRAIIRDPLLPNDWCAGPQLHEVLNETIEFARDAQYIWRKYLDIQSDLAGRSFWLQDLDRFFEGKTSKN